MKIEIYKNGIFVGSDDNRTLEEAKNEKINFIKEIATFHIKNSGLDEITQLNAIAGIYNQERCNAIKSYISSCRNEYLRCKGIILSSKTNDECDTVQFIAPQVPEGI